MISNDEWHGVPLDRDAEWKAVFQSSREILNLSAPCPICRVMTLHRWYQIHQPEERVIDGLRFIGRGGLWEWCSACRSFQHYSCYVPEWWSCDLEIDEKKLTALPTAIEEAIRKRGQKL